MEHTVTYTETTSAYNDRRYGKPWMAELSDSLTRNFSFIDWDGRPGSSGQFHFSATPGTLLAYGQKDIRKGRGGVDGYQICLPDGSLPIISDTIAATVLSMGLDARWQYVAKVLLRKAVTRPTEEYKLTDWERTRNADVATYSTMLGVANPITTEISEFLGLSDPEPKPMSVETTADLSAFGL